MTERIYYEHAYQTECESMVIECGQRNGYPALQLNRTVFYPTSGGQPNDTGQIASEAVVDVIVGDDGNVWHLLTENASIPTVGQTVDCIIDWDRRYDHMQQHTGQHLISQVFYQLLGYETVSVHFGETESTLDLEVPTIEFAQLDEAERYANELGFSSLPIRAYSVDEANLASIPLRRPPKVTGKIRIVEIDAFDYSACGGTHTHTTAEILPIKFLKQERRRNQTRLTFLCGKRALRDYGEKHRLLTMIANGFSTEISQTLPLVERLMSQNKDYQTKVEALTSEVLRYEAQALVDQAPMHHALMQSEFRVIQLVFEERDVATVRLLANLLVAHVAVVVLFACASHDKATLIFARSVDLNIHMGNLLKSTLTAFGGNGGGKPEFAQGGGASWKDAKAMLNFALQQI